MDSFTAPFPTPNPAWDDASPGFSVIGLENTPGKKAFLIHLEAKPGKEDLVAGFLRDINDGVNQEPGTGPWFAWRFSKTAFGVFEAFPDDKRRLDHVFGPGGNNFLRSELLKEMLAWPAQIYRLDVLHGKFDVLFGKPVTTAGAGEEEASLGASPHHERF
jgi:hypothetical protein